MEALDIMPFHCTLQMWLEKAARSRTQQKMTVTLSYLSSKLEEQRQLTTLLQSNNSTHIVYMKKPAS